MFWSNRVLLGGSSLEDGMNVARVLFCSPVDSVRSRKQGVCFVVRLVFHIDLEFLADTFISSAYIPYSDYNPICEILL